MAVDLVAPVVVDSRKGQAPVVVDSRKGQAPVAAVDLADLVALVVGEGASGNSWFLISMSIITLGEEGGGRVKYLMNL